MSAVQRSRFHFLQAMRLIERHQIGDETLGLVGRHNFPAHFGWRIDHHQRNQRIGCGLAADSSLLIEETKRRHVRIRARHCAGCKDGDGARQPCRRGAAIRRRVIFSFGEPEDAGVGSELAAAGAGEVAGAGDAPAGAGAAGGAAAAGDCVAGAGDAAAAAAGAAFGPGGAAAGCTFHPQEVRVPNIRQIRTHPRFAEQHRTVENVIARCAAAFAPFPFDVRSGVIRADLLAVAIDAAVRGINLSAALGHSGFRHRINIGAFLVHLRIEMADLQVRNEGQTQPMKTRTSRKFRERVA